MDAIRDAINLAVSHRLTEAYARKRKTAPGQKDLFTGEERASSKTQKKIPWNESKHPRASDGRFGTKAGSHTKKADTSASSSESSGSDSSVDRDRESIGQMASGAKRRSSDEKQRRDDWHGQNDPEAKWAKYQPDWTEFEGTLALQVPGSRFVAVAASGRKDSKNWIVFDTSEPDEEYAFLKNDEVRGWLAKRAKADTDDAADHSGDESEQSNDNGTANVSAGEVHPDRDSIEGVK